MKIIDGHVNLEKDSVERPKPSVDMLLSSAAKAFGEHLIAVIFTGSGSDGAARAVDVKNAGGVVIFRIRKRRLIVPCRCHCRLQYD